MKLPDREKLAQASRDVFVAWDFGVGVLSSGLAFGLCWNKSVRDSVTTILVAEAAFAVAVTATVLAAMAIFATFYDPSYRRVLDLAPGGFSGALRPYEVVGVVAAAATIVGTLGALAVPAVGVAPVATITGASTLLCVWSLAGTASLIDITVFHAARRAELMRGADEAEAIRAKRLSERL